MPTKNVVSVTPEVLVWARETAHLSIVGASKNIIPHEKLLKIERGEDFPTLIQLRNLAHRYDRSLSTLMGNKIPEDDYKKIPFFRKENKTEYDSPLALFIRDIQKKQDWARNYLLDEGIPALEFIGSVKIKDNHKQVASKIKERLGLPSFTEYGRRESYFHDLRTSLEKNNIFVSVTGSDQSSRAISPEQAQGFAIPDSVAPFLFVNTRSTINSKIFTLIHEVVHLFLDEMGISEDPIKFRKPDCNEDEIENFCNLVAAEILMPEDEFREQWDKTKGTIEERIEKVGQNFLVSSLSVCVKAWHLGIISGHDFSVIFPHIKEKINEWLRMRDEKRKEANGGGDYYLNMRSQNGILLSQLAFYAYKGGNVMATEISKVLTVKVSNFDNYFSKI